MYRLKRLRKRSRILICFAIGVVVAIALMYRWQIDFQEYYSNVMKELNTPEAKAYMLDKINGKCNFTELLYWTDQQLSWANDSFVRYSAPQQILIQGKGLCEEYTIVYVGACLALGYEARILVSRQFYQGPVHGFHVWAEVKWNGVWTQADPSPTPFWNDPSHYRSWDWGPRATLRVYAFEPDEIEDVSATYR